MTYNWRKNSSTVDLTTGCFIMFSVITNIYNKKTKRHTLMELFKATGKLIFFFWQLEIFDVCTTGDTAHIDTIFKLLPHTRQHETPCISYTYEYQRRAEFRTAPYCKLGQVLCKSVLMVSLSFGHGPSEQLFWMTDAQYDGNLFWNIFIIFLFFPRIAPLQARIRARLSTNVIWIYL